MILNFYCQYDRVSGIYSDLFPAVNDEVAVRSYRTFLSASQVNVFNQFANDKEIYMIGTFNDQIGEFVPSKPRLLCRALDFAGGDRNDEV